MGEKLKSLDALDALKHGLCVVQCVHRAIKSTLDDAKKLLQE